MSFSGMFQKIDLRSWMIGVLSTVLVFCAFYIHTLSAEPQDQQNEQQTNVVAHSLTIVNKAGNPVCQIAADSTGNGFVIVRNREATPLVLMRGVKDNNVESGMVYCNGIGVWGQSGKVNTLINAKAIQYLNQ